MDLKRYLKEKIDVINSEIKRILDKEAAHPLREVFSYSMGSGKRFRPILVMAAAEACGFDAESVLPAAVSMEMIHNFSLIHDDLPCMDNDLERRGAPTCHAKFGETEALLAGDALLVFAFEMLARNAEIPGIKPESVIKTFEVYSKAAGHHGMTGGQVLDMRYQGRSGISPDILTDIHRKKTGALITASVMAGGILAGAGSEEISRLEAYGKNIGLTYQIIDDLLDMDDDAETISFPTVFGKEKSKKMAEQATEEAVKNLDIFGEKAEALRLLADYLLKRKY